MAEYDTHLRPTIGEAFSKKRDASRRSMRSISQNQAIVAMTASATVLQRQLGKTPLRIDVKGMQHPSALMSDRSAEKISPDIVVTAVHVDPQPKQRFADSVLFQPDNLPVQPASMNRFRQVPRQD